MERDGIRTHDLPLAKRTLFQLSYTPNVLVERDGARTRNLLRAKQTLFQIELHPQF